MKTLITVVATVITLAYVRKKIGGLTLLVSNENQSLIAFKPGQERFLVLAFLDIPDYQEQMESLWNGVEDAVQRRMLGIEDSDLPFGEDEDGTD